jgi:hypothetical protein
MKKRTKKKPGPKPKATPKPWKPGSHAKKPPELLQRGGRKRLTEAQKIKVVEKRRKVQAEARRAQTRTGQDIGEIPPVVNPERREACRGSFKLFCTTYFPAIFYLPWSKDLNRVATKVEQVVIDHDKLVILMPRGSGKSALAKCAVLWAVLYGRHPYVKLIGAVSDDATKALQWFKDELSENEILLEDFPEVCFPAKLLEGETRRCLGQRYQGKKTNIRWGKDRIVLPKIPESVSSQAVIETNSLEGHIRGAWIRIEGKLVRPTLAICDDPQNAETSRSQGPSGQTTYRLQTINQDVQGLAGPTERTAILIPATVITAGDLADQLLKDKKYRGERMKRFYSFPSNKKLWEEYRQLRESAMNSPDKESEATEFYRCRMATCGRPLDGPADGCATCPRNKTCMDCGAVVDWAARTDDPKNLSAVQAAMHSLYDYGPEGFASEFQNEPLVETHSSDILCPIEKILTKLNGVPQGVVPLGAQVLNLFIDMKKSYMTWMVCAWGRGFTGSIVSYGTWPDQGRREYDSRNPSHTLAAKYPTAGVEGAWYAGLTDLTQKLLGREWPVDGGGVMRIGGATVDANYGNSTETVYLFCRQSPHAALLLPWHGMGVGPSGRTMAEYTISVKDGDKAGDHLIVKARSTTGQKSRAIRHMLCDVNHWKAFVHARLNTAMGDTGSLYLFGDKPEMHRLLAAHLHAEKVDIQKSEKTGRTAIVFTEVKGIDNDLLDSLVGCAARASQMGITLIGHEAPPPKRRKRAENVVNAGFQPELG